MSSQEKLKILILEDNRDHIAVAKAGLLPAPPENISDIAGKNRAKLADEFFQILHCYTIAKALNEIEVFVPDIAIIDIDLKDKNGGSIEGSILKNGLDFYRHIQNKYPQTQPIYFTSEIGAYQSQMSEDELKHFRAKGSSGSGHENLSRIISTYLYEAAKKIVNDAIPGVKDKIRTDLGTLPTSSVLSNTYLFGDRIFSIKNILVFCGYPVLIKNSKPSAYELEYHEPGGMLLKLLEQDILSYGNSFRSEWEQPYMQNAILYYHSNLTSELEPEVTKGVSQLINRLLSKINQDTAYRFTGLGYGDFRTKEYKNKTLATDKNFKKKFANTLVVRRYFFVLEIFMREFIDANKGKPKQVFKKYLKSFVNETLQGLKLKSDGIYTTKELTQFGVQLNMGFKIDTKESFKREKVEIDKYVVFNFEKKWLDSDECRNLKQQLKISMLDQS